jgi:hypothetical protein
MGALSRLSLSQVFTTKTASSTAFIVLLMMENNVKPGANTP